jgi:signal transduction histidine kinase
MTSPNGNPAVVPELELQSDRPSTRLRWLTLIVGGALLVLLLLSGGLAIRIIGEMHAQQQSVTHALSERTEMLSGLWLSVQNYNDAVRQFVKQAGAERDLAARRRLDQLTLQIDSQLKRYPSSRDSDEAALVNGIQEVFSQQRTLYVSAVEPMPNERQRQTNDERAQRLASLQQLISGWSGKFREWNGQRLEQADHTLVTKFGTLQQGLSRALMAGFASGLLLVLGSMMYIARLERQTHHRYVQLARSQHELQRLSARLLDAQETERRSISRELHDEIGQSLGALLVDIGRLSTLLSTVRPEVRTQLDNMKSVAERTLQSVRNIALLLRPSMLDDLGLVAALEWQGREISRRGEIEVAVESEDVPDDLPDEYRVCIYRLVQEALNNALRHSGARNAKVTVGRTANNIEVRVSDDGSGFDPARTRGLGILGMEERVKRLGGTFTVQSKPEQGVVLIAVLPWPPSEWLA